MDEDVDDEVGPSAGVGDVVWSSSGGGSVVVMADVVFAAKFIGIVDGEVVDKGGYGNAG